MELKSHNTRTRVAIIALLIVPYGIEIQIRQEEATFWEPLNRTLWN